MSLSTLRSAAARALTRSRLSSSLTSPRVPLVDALFAAGAAASGGASGENSSSASHRESAFNRAAAAAAVVGCLASAVYLRRRLDERGDDAASATDAAALFFRVRAAETLSAQPEVAEAESATLTEDKAEGLSGRAPGAVVVEETEEGGGEGGEGGRSSRRTKAEASSSEEEGGGSEEEGKREEEGEKKKKRVGFHDRRIIEYENRIRAYSTPDKIFRYFATLEHKVEADAGGLRHYEILMTPEDFVRSITPGIKQPEGMGLDQFKRYNPEKHGPSKVDCSLGEDSIFYKLGENGLITFTDYIFLLTILTLPPRHFEIAFKMFDFDGNGEVDHHEFIHVQSILRSQTATGMRHRDHGTTGSVLNKTIRPALATYFFGVDGEKKLTVDKFIDFQQKLQGEVLRLEFNRYEPNETGKIQEVDFADSLLTHAGFTEKKMMRMKKRVKKAFKDDENQFGISFKEFMDFFHFLGHIHDVDVALTYYHVAGASVDQVTFKHVAKTVAGVSLSDHLVDVVYILFDENQDGELSQKEFVSVMKQRGMRGLEKPRDTGFTKLLSAMWKCGMQSTLKVFDH